MEAAPEEMPARIADQDNDDDNDNIVDLNHIHSTEQMPLLLTTDPDTFYPSSEERANSIMQMRNGKKPHCSLGEPLSIHLINDFFPRKDKPIKIYEDVSAGFVGVVPRQEMERRTRMHRHEPPPSGDAIRARRLQYYRRHRGPPIVGRGRRDREGTQSELEAWVPEVLGTVEEEEEDANEEESEDVEMTHAEPEAETADIQAEETETAPVVDTVEEEAFRERAARRREAWEPTTSEDGRLVEGTAAVADADEGDIVVGGADIRTMDAAALDTALRGQVARDEESSESEEESDSDMGSPPTENYTPPSSPLTSPTTQPSLSMDWITRAEMESSRTKKEKPVVHRNWLAFEKCPAELLVKRNASLRMR